MNHTTFLIQKIYECIIYWVSVCFIKIIDTLNNSDEQMLHSKTVLIHTTMHFMHLNLDYESVLSQVHIQLSIKSMQNHRIKYDYFAWDSKVIHD